MTYLGKVAMDSGDPATAMLYFERVLEINYERGYHHYQVLDLRNIGLVYLNLMCYDRALLAFDEALSIQELAATEDNLLRAYRAICLMSMGQINEGLARLTEAVGRGERDTYNDCLLHLEYVRGLGLADDPVHAHEQALALVRKVKVLNPVLYGRALLEQGRASHALRDPAAMTLLEEALRHEKQYGGRDLWLCYDALAQMVTDTAARLHHLRLAAETLRHTGNTLINRPDLQYAFLNHPRVKAILDETGL
jgi:tetratricopeptide (TPR) repeat protein